MNLHKALHGGLTAIALTFAVALSGGVYAQASASGTQQPSRRQSQSGANAAQNLLNGLNVGPLMMSFGGANGVMIDFTRSNARVLIERSDVRSELFIDSKQRDELSDIDQRGTQELQRKMMQTVIQNTVNNPDFKALAQLGNAKQPNPGAVQDVLNTSFQAMQDGLQSVQSTLDGQEEAILYPKQIKRLHELDMQWRGLLALSDKKVAEELKVTAEQKAVVDAALKSYQTTQMNTLEPIMEQAMQYNQQAAGSNRAPRTFDQQQMQRALANAMDTDTIKTARSSDEDKVKACLTPSQLAQWKTMNGQKFYFTRLD